MKTSKGNSHKKVPDIASQNTPIYESSKIYPNHPKTQIGNSGLNSKSKPNHSTKLTPQSTTPYVVVSTVTPAMTEGDNNAIQTTTLAATKMTSTTTSNNIVSTTTMFSASSVSTTSEASSTE